jgi:hypothetical protein
VHVEDAEVVHHPVAGLALGRLQVLRTLVAVELAESRRGHRAEQIASEKGNQRSR